jgi:thiosulfate/3-mercaptopyruvate sulfurtransferase
MAITISSPLVETAWLEEHLADPALRILDCTVFLRPPANAPEAGRASWASESGRAGWAERHIPGSGFADLIADLSDTSSRLPFTMPSASQFTAAMSRLGVGPGTAVVCYDANMSMWAARGWWMLRAFGFDNAAVLNGGWRKWTAEGRPVSSEVIERPAGNFVAHPRPELIAAKQDVLGAIGDGSACIVNALSASQAEGRHASPYGRPGRIASSVNVSATDIVDRETHVFLAPEQLRERFSAVGATDAGRVITYCGGGIAACSDALALTLLAHENVAVYDASLSEWARDESLPMETGPLAAG